MNEVWKDVEGLPSYQISNLGRVKSLSKLVKTSLGHRTTKERILKQSLIVSGYQIAMIQRRSHLIHRLVAQAFIPNPENKKQVNHIDGNKCNNNLSNLEWATQSENMKHSFRVLNRKNNDWYFTIDGECKPLRKILRERNIIHRYQTVFWRLKKKGLSIEDAIENLNP